MGLIIEIIFYIVLILILIVHIFMRKSYHELVNEDNNSKLSGFEIAQKVVEKLNVKEPHIIKKKGLLLDHYNYERNVIKLSPEVFDGTDIYAGIVAINTALLTSKDKVAKGHKFTSFLVLLSYIVIVLGGFLNNPNIIHFGLILFILAFIFEMLLLDKLFKNEEEIDKLYKSANTEKLLKPYKEYKNDLIILNLINVATLPYNFINYFR